jgi:nucleoside-diphosphate-sugar epimerase
VWGTGDQMRDFIYIEDCVDGVLATMDKIDDGAALNLSTGIYTSFKQFARIAAEECGYEPEVIGLSDKPSGVFARAGDTKKQADYGFSYSTDFRNGIRKALTRFKR